MTKYALTILSILSLLSVQIVYGQGFETPIINVTDKNFYIQYALYNDLSAFPLPYLMVQDKKIKKRKIASARRTHFLFDDEITEEVIYDRDGRVTTFTVVENDTIGKGRSVRTVCRYQYIGDSKIELERTRKTTEKAGKPYIEMQYITYFSNKRRLIDSIHIRTISVRPNTDTTTNDYLHYYNYDSLDRLSTVHTKQSNRNGILYKLVYHTSQKLTFDENFGIEPAYREKFIDKKDTPLHIGKKLLKEKYLTIVDSVTGKTVTIFFDRRSVLQFYYYPKKDGWRDASDFGELYLKWGRNGKLKNYNRFEIVDFGTSDLKSKAIVESGRYDIDPQLLLFKNFYYVPNGWVFNYYK